MTPKGGRGRNLRHESSQLSPNDGSKVRVSLSLTKELVEEIERLFRLLDGVKIWVTEYGIDASKR